ncbi:hypothetical protein ACVWW5_001742 [Bradyrhizobium sp. LM3.4]
MRIIAKYLATTSLVLVTSAAALPSWAADVDATSAIDTVTVYPDGATVTRIIALDVASGDSTLVARDFPLSLDPSSLRVEGEAGAKLTIGTIDARPPRAAPPVNLSELDKRIETLKDERSDLQGAIDAAVARRKFAQRFAEASPAGLGEKGEARPITEWRAAFGAVGEEIATADTAIRDATRKQREIDRQIAQLEAERSAKPPSKLEVRIDVASAAATKATLRVTYAVRNARWLPLYDARLDTGAKDRKPQLERGPPRRGHAIDRRGLVERDAWRLHGSPRSWRQRAGAELAGRAVFASAEAARVGFSLRYGNACGGTDAAKGGSPRLRWQIQGRSCGTRRRTAGRCRDRRFPGHLQDSRPRQPRRRRGRQEPARRFDERARRSHGARGTGDGPDRLPRSELQAD